MKLSPTITVYDRAWRIAMAEFAPSMLITLVRISRQNFKSDVMVMQMIWIENLRWWLTQPPIIIDSSR